MAGIIFYERLGRVPCLCSDFAFKWCMFGGLSDDFALVSVCVQCVFESENTSEHAF